MTTQSTLAEVCADIVCAPRALLFVDIPGSLRITRELGDTRAYQLLKSLSETLRTESAGNGRRLRSLGDGFLLAFDSVDDALEQAAAAQRGIARVDTDGVTIRLRCGIHFGEIVEADGDAFGVGVYLANRVCSYAQGDEILLSDAARDACTLPDGAFNDFGPTLLPGFEDPVRLFEYPWR